MPAPWFPVPSPLPPLCLYRHILREASYLPPAFRVKVVDTIRHRFHNNRLDTSLAKTRISRARTVLRTLRAANSGETDAMTKLIYLGFGRAGSFRRELISEFVKPQGPSDSKALDALLDKAAEPDSKAQGADKSETQKADQGDVPEAVDKKRKPKIDFFLRWDRPKLLQLNKSQRQQQTVAKSATGWPRAALKNFNQNQFVPATNIWGKPPSESLVRTKRAKWWKIMVDKLLPPLSKGQWELLGQLSEGAQDSGNWAIPKRRPAAQAQSIAPHQWDWRAYASTTVNIIEKPKSLYNQRRSGQRDMGPYSVRQRKDKISLRWFRRQYKRTWLVTPTMSQNANTLRHSISWGQAASGVSPATRAQLEIFQGVNAHGRRS
ncbi:hypothetical protein XA68_15005 [Ophiocordyceps unilateralis]|uniref:LYR motif-containing protein Cup1-like N-terminal domain-containing protein n=1 Tax=Ophiocordyceps unilateralis TaxID=268505 RepID=A0A2A9P9B3_OPHUN|nr:hypothetical protein XA68_15005 [Ophiocordyceps unilateralis]